MTASKLTSEVSGTDGVPSCISTDSSNGCAKMEPFSFQGELNEAMFRLVRTVEAIPRSRVTGIGPDYLLVEFTNKGSKAVDDVEFHLDPNLKLIHFKTSSKQGEPDLGANQRRMEEIKKVFESLK